MHPTSPELQPVWSQLLEQQNLPLALKTLRQFLNEKGIPQFDARLDDIMSSYQLMKDYMLRGYQDPMRPQLYHSMLQQLYAVAFDVRLRLAVIKGGYHGLAELSARRIDLSSEEVRLQLEGYVQDLAMLSLEPEGIRKEKEHYLRRQHQHYLSSVFDAIVVSYYWNEAVYDALLKLFCSPMVDTFDSQTLLSAVTLSGMNGFDPLRFKLLLEVWQQTEADEELRQRAFVGWVLLASSDGMQLFETSAKLLKETVEAPDSDALRRDLYALQCQIFFCSNARRDNEKMQKDIIPTLMKGQQLRFNRFGIEEKEEDTLEDILHPDKAEQEMERAEESINRMMEMQKQGADIYFGGFSQMKRFPFFSSVSNWFVPFSKQNPDMEAVLNQLGNAKIVDIMLNGSPFCNSDKYSFGFAIKSVYAQLPANVREMMNSADGMMLRPSYEDADKPAYKRLQYLQDLYRFFELNAYREEFRNPFWNDCSAEQNDQFFLHRALSFSAFHKEIIALMAFAVKRKEWKFLRQLYARYPLSETEIHQMLVSDSERLLRYYRLQYTLFNHFHEEKKAFAASRAVIVVGLLRHEESGVGVERLEFDDETGLPTLSDKLLKLDNANEKELRSYAASALRYGRFDEANRAYQYLYTMKDDKRFLWYQSLALMNMGQLDDALKLLYPLDMEDENVSVKRTIAWILLLQCKPMQAERYYDAILSTQEVIDEDYVNAGYSKWLQNKNNEAVILFKSWVSRHSDEKISSVFVQDRQLLVDNGITAIDRMLMEDMVETS